MLRSILVPLDGSDFGERALPLARRLARSAAVPLHLVHVHVPHVPDGLLSNPQFHFEGLTMDEYDDRDAEEESRYLGDAARRLGGDGGPEVSTAMLEGDMADALERFATDGHQGLVVMSTHGRTGARRVWLGSRADQLVRHTHLPLFLVPPGPHGAETPADVGHVLVALDGSAFSEQILEPAADLARATGARLTLLHVVLDRIGLGARAYPLPSGHVEQRRVRAEDYLERIAPRMRTEVEDVEPLVVVHASPAAGILAAAADVGADCVALATHGYGGVRRTVLGSVADALVRESDRPILLQRPW